MTDLLRGAFALHGPWLYYPGGHMRLSTTLMAAAIMLTGVLWTHRPYIAFASMMAWVCAYEILWEAATTLTGGGSWGYEGWFIAAVASWVLLAHALGVRPDWRLVAACAAVLAVWLGLGFHSNWANLPHQFSLRDEVLNESSKTLLGLAYLVGAVRAGGAHPAGRRAEGAAGLAAP